MRSEPFPLVSLGELCANQGGTIQTGPFGSQLHASDYTLEGVPVVMPVNIVNGRVSTIGISRISQHIAERLSQHKLLPGDIVFSRRGDVTRFALVHERERDWLCGTGCIRIRVGPGSWVLPEYIACALATPEAREWLVRHAVGATMPNLNASILSALPLRIPPLTLQQEIARTLAALEYRAELLTETNETLEYIAQSIFKSWFIDFDPVHAKAEGREPEGMDAETAALFPSEFEESELGPIPKGWKLGTLAELSELNPEAWSAKSHPTMISYVDLSNVKQNQIDEVVEYPFQEAPSRARRVLRSGDTIIGTVRPGNQSYAFVAREGLTGSTGFAVLRPTSKVFAEYIYLAATRTENIERLSNLADGGAYPAVSPTLVHHTPVILPPAPLFTVFSDIVGPLLAQHAQNQSFGHTLADFRDTLLPRLISGQIPVPQAQEAIQEVLS